MGKVILKGLKRKAARSVATVGVLVATVLHPAAATADAILYGLTRSSLHGDQLGTIDPITGNFTQIDTTGLDLSVGHYAPVFDPSRNVFYYTDTPTSDDGPFSGAVNKIDLATGAVTSLPHAPHGQTPKLGVLHPSLVRRARAAFDAAG